MDYGNINDLNGQLLGIYNEIIEGPALLLAAKGCRRGMYSAGYGEGYCRNTTGCCCTQPNGRGTCEIYME